MLVVEIIEKAFRGIRIGVSILIIQAAVRMIRKMVKKSPDKKLQICIAIFFFLAVFLMNIAGVHIYHNRTGRGLAERNQIGKHLRIHPLVGKNHISDQRNRTIRAAKGK